MNRYELYLKGQQSIRVTDRIPRWKKRLFKRAIKDAIRHTAELWPTENEAVGDQYQYSSVRNRLLDYGYTRIWMWVIGPLVRQVILILMDGIVDEDGHLIKVSD